MENESDIIIYQTNDGLTKVDVKFEGETVWLSQEQMATLFQRDKSVITRHIHNIYEEGELELESTSAKYAFVPESRERSYEITYYNLDVIISEAYWRKLKQRLKQEGNETVTSCHALNKPQTVHSK